MQDISIEILPRASNHSQLIVNFPWPLEQVIAELEQEQWRPYGMETGVAHDIWTGKRYKLHRPQGQILQQIMQYFAQESTRRYVVECLYRDKPNMAVNWQLYPWRMIQNTMLHAEFTKDLPGFENGIHCDMRRLVGTGMIYLCEGNNPNLASAFYSHPDRWSENIVETGYGLGWIHSNDWDTWHDGWNRTDQVRYSILLGLTLRIEHQPEPTDGPEESVQRQ
jgi:hypothetical protein